MKGLTGPQQRRAEYHQPATAPIAHILVVDDDPMSRKLLGINLRDAGYSVICAEDAIAAGHCVVERLPDLVIADFKMPYMNGDEFVAALRADSSIPDLPVIFITSVENRPQIAGKTFGFPLLTKPLQAEELLAIVAAQLRSRQP
ncbi:MAG TPA: response regulator [Burkholderiales bacterium]|jgi:DNA-binding response OmpR family regulator|nr:response regulator [Burkholderiales bacterium]